MAEIKASFFNETLNFENDFINLEDDDLELEPLEQEYITEIPEDVSVDADFLGDVSNTLEIDKFEQKNVDKKSEVHPMDLYLKKLIKDVFISEILPIIEQKMKQIIIK